MKEGDLVELSSYGRKLVCIKEFVDCLGVITWISPVLSDKLDYKVDWYKNGEVLKSKHRRKDLKLFKK